MAKRSDDRFRPRPRAPRARGSSDQSPFLRTNEEQAVKVRKRLEDIFSNISLVHDVIVMSIEVCESNSGDFNPEMSHVLRRCGANKLHSQLQALTSIIEKFGGKTEFSKTNDLGICAEVPNDPS